MHSVKTLLRHTQPVNNTLGNSFYFELMFNRSEANCPKAGFVSLCSLSGVCSLSLPRCCCMSNQTRQEQNMWSPSPCHRSAMAVWQHWQGQCSQQ